ncbi:MAG: hypothetical protein WDZ58_00755, partial [Gemmatimonadaceae bacterium]
MSPRESEITLALHVPERVRDVMMDMRSALRAVALRGLVALGGGGGGGVRRRRWAARRWAALRCAAVCRRAWNSTASRP